MICFVLLCLINVHTESGEEEDRNATPLQHVQQVSSEESGLKATQNDLPCECNSEGRQIYDQYDNNRNNENDWCWLSDDHKTEITCTLLNGYTYTNSWARCQDANRKTLVDCDVLEGCDADPALPRCQCNSLGRLYWLGEFNYIAKDSDYCYLIEENTTTACALSNGCVADSWYWSRCTHNGVEQINCGGNDRRTCDKSNFYSLDSCTCNSEGAYTDRGGHTWCWLRDDHGATTCNMMDGCPAYSEAWMYCWVGRNNDIEQVDCVPVCACNKDGRQINKVHGDWCYLLDNESKTTCYSLDGYYYTDTKWLHCEHDGTTQVDCEPRDTCRCNYQGRIKDTYGDYCWLKDDHTGTTCMLHDETLSVGKAWSFCYFLKNGCPTDTLMLKDSKVQRIPKIHDNDQNDNHAFNNNNNYYKLGFVIICILIFCILIGLCVFYCCYYSNNKKIRNQIDDNNTENILLADELVNNGDDICLTTQ